MKEKEREMFDALMKREVILREKTEKEEERKEQEKKEAKELCKPILEKEVELSERHEKGEKATKREKDNKSWKDHMERDARLFGYDGPLIHHRGREEIGRAARERDGDNVDIGYGHRDGLGFSFGPRKKYFKYN